MGSIDHNPTHVPTPPTSGEAQRPRETPHVTRQETRPDVIAQLESLDDVIFAAIEGDPAALQAATEAWQKAVAVQDALDYNEPPDWYYTLRESLGYAYLAQAQYQDAERAFREDLADNRLSGRSLFGLARSLEHQPGKTVPAWLEQQFAQAWRNATVSPTP